MWHAEFKFDSVGLDYICARSGWPPFGSVV